MSIRFYKADGPIRVYDGTRYLVLGPKKYDSIYNRIRYFIGVKSGIAYAFSHNCARMKVDLYDSFPLEKTLTFYNVIILIKSNQFWIKTKITTTIIHSQKNVLINNKNMLNYNVSETIDINTTNASKECDICHYWYPFR